MAYKRKRSSSKRRPIKRAKFTRRRGLKGRKYAMRRNPFPTSVVVRMRYSDTCEFDPSASVPDDFLYRCNSIFDPSQSGTGHQPYGHDQYQSLYNHYKVLKSRITVTFISTSVTTNTGAAFVGVAVKDDTTVEQSPDTMREAKGSRNAVLLPGMSKTISMGYNGKIHFPQIFQAISANFGSNPSEEAYFQLFTTPISTTIDPSFIVAKVSIDYTVKCWELKDLGQS